MLFDHSAFFYFFTDSTRLSANLLKKIRLKSRMMAMEHWQ
jgi:hypothetical protein